MRFLDRSDIKRTAIQVAARDRWENALAVDSTNVGTIREWLVDAGANVAIESVYSDQSGALGGFIGFRRCLESTKDRCLFWLDVIAAAMKFEGQGPRAQLAEWLDTLGHPTLLDTVPTGAELGVFNQWLSAGAVPLHGDRLTIEDLKHGPAWIRHGASAPICRETAWLAPEGVWIAEVGSHEEGGVYLLDRSLLPC